MRFLLDHEIIPIAYSPIGRPGDEANGATQILDDPLVLSLADKHSRSPVEIVLNWGLCRGYSIIPRSSQLAHQIENIRALEFRLEDTEVKAITAKLDDGTLNFTAPSDIQYNLFA